MMDTIVIPNTVRAAIDQGPLPLFIYDAMQFRERVMIVRSLLDGYFYPIKVCPEHGILLIASEAGAGFDLCSEGDTLLAESIPGPGKKWSFTSVHATPQILKELLMAQAIFDADSMEQAEMWRKIGGKICGLRISTDGTTSVYGAKFGIIASEIGKVVQALKRSDLSVAGLHIHESHAHRTTEEMANRLLAIFTAVDSEVLKKCRYVNIGGGWPLRNGFPVPVKEIAIAFSWLRNALAKHGFFGRIFGEPGEWVIGPTGYWAACVSAVKRHPLFPERRIIILDTATPIPCRPSDAPFLLINNAGKDDVGIEKRPCDIYGSANTGSDSIGQGVLLGDVQPGGIVVALGQGAYIRSLIGSFNERGLPHAVIV